MKKSIQNNVLVYYLYKILSLSNMRGPILIIFMMKYCGMPLSEVYFCEACCVVLAAVLQIPTGVLADRWGRAKTVRVGCFVIILELICFSLANEHILLWIANALWAIGFSLISNADTAFLYDSLKQETKCKAELETRYRNIEGRSIAFGLIITAFMSLVAGYLSEINIRIPLIIDSILITAAFIATFWFFEPNIHRSVKLKYVNHMCENIVYVISKKQILWIILFSTLLGVSSKLWFFTYNPYFELVKLDLKYYGIVFFMLNIVAFFSSYYANRISARLENSSGISFSIGILTLPMIIMGSVISKWSIPLVLFQNTIRGYLGPLVGNMINKRIESGNRATILSVKTAIYHVFEVLCMGIFGLFVMKYSLSAALISLGVVSSFLGFLLVLNYIKHFQR